MNVGKAIYYLLANAESVTDIAGTRIYPELAEQEAVVPYAVYQIVSVNPDDTNDGPAVIDEVVVDILCVAESYNEAADLASVVRSALDRVRGTYNGVNVESIQYDSTDSDVQDSPRRYEQTVTVTVRVFRDAAQIATGQNIDQLTLGRLYDVTDDATTGQVIIKQADGTWAGGDAAGALGDLTDVAADVTSEAIDRHALVYDEDSGEWIPRYPGEIRVINQSGETLLKGQLATAVGAQGDQVEVRPYDSQDDWRYLVGIATEEMVDGASGHVITLGEVRGLDTDQFNVGDLLYPTGLINAFSPFGLTKFGETAGGPDNPLPIAMCTRSHANTGRIQVRMWTPGHIKQLAGLKDVYVPSPYVGAILKYVKVGSSYIWGYLPQTSKSILDGATEDVEIYYYAEGGDTQLDTNALSDTPSSGNKIVRKIWYATSSQADPDTGTWTLYQTLADNATFAQLQAAFEASLLVSPTGGQPVSIKTTWEDVPAFTGLLDTYSGAAAAYSLRLLRSDYTGDAINVRRASDNAVQDIGFDANGDLDTSALATFCAGTDGYVVRWYDQSENSNDATQATTAAQPKIYDSSTGVVTENGKPAIETDGTDDVLEASLNCGSNFQLALIGATKNSGYGYFTNLASSDDGVEILNFNTSYRFSLEGNDDTLSVSSGAQTLAMFSYDGTNKIYSVDGTENVDALTTTVAVSAGLEFGKRLGSNPVNAVYQEFILWNVSTHISSRADIKSNINDYYSIY